MERRTILTWPPGRARTHNQLNLHKSARIAKGKTTASLGGPPTSSFAEPDSGVEGSRYEVSTRCRHADARPGLFRRFSRTVAGLIAGAVSGAGFGALVSALMTLGMSKNDALKYESRLKAGEFLVSVTGTHEKIETARALLQGTGEVDLQTYQGAQQETA
jgi:hypothetical protein